MNVDRGLFFIEQGIVKVERDADATVTRKGNGDTFSRTASNNWGSLNQLKCADVARAIADMKAKDNKSWEQRSFRVARYVFAYLVLPGSSYETKLIVFLAETVSDRAGSLV